LARAAQLVKALKLLIHLSITVIVQAITQLFSGLSSLYFTAGRCLVRSAAVYPHPLTEAQPIPADLPQLGKGFIDLPVTIIVQTVTALSPCLYKGCVAEQLMTPLAAIPNPDTKTGPLTSCTEGVA